MGWLFDALEEIDAGRPVQVRPLGGSMKGLIESGQLVTLIPVTDPVEVRAGDAVLVRWKGTHILHLVVEVNGEQFLIGNNLGKKNGWVAAADIRAKVIEVEGRALP